jgi:hypothetical protein
MRKRKLLIVTAGLAVVVAAGVVVLWPRADRVTRENYDRVELGMSRSEVEAILGPGGDYRTGHGETGYGIPENMYWTADPDPASTVMQNWSRNPGLPNPPENPLLWAFWVNDSFAIVIGIDDSGSVVEKLGYPRRTTKGPLDNLLWRLKRAWHRWFP